MARKSAWIAGCLVLMLAGCPPQAPDPGLPRANDPSSAEAKPSETSSPDPADSSSKLPSSITSPIPLSGATEESGTGDAVPNESVSRDWQAAREQAAAALMRSDQAQASGDLNAALQHALDARGAVARSDWGKSTDAKASEFQGQIDQRLSDLDSAGAGRATSGSPPQNIKIR